MLAPPREHERPRRPSMAFGQLLGILTARELRLRYRRTVLGWAWSMLNPILMTAIYGVVFGALFRIAVPVGSPSGIRGFTFFLLSGLLPWNLLATAVGGSTMLITGNAHLIKRVRFRSEVLVASSVLALAISLLIELLALVLAVALTQRVIPIRGLLGVPMIVLLLFGFVLGTSLLVASLAVFLRDLQYLVAIGLTAWLYLSAVVYPIRIIPARVKFAGHVIPLRTFIRSNPMTAFVSAFRRCLYDGRFPSANTLVQLTIYAIVSIGIGLTVFRRLSRHFTNAL